MEDWRKKKSVYSATLNIHFLLICAEVFVCVPFLAFSLIGVVSCYFPCVSLFLNYLVFQPFDFERTIYKHFFCFFRTGFRHENIFVMQHASESNLFLNVIFEGKN
jgi:hypothetical protein